MYDLISRKALTEKAWEADTQCGYVQVVDVGDIENAPAVDAAPMVHGRWIVFNDGTPENPQRDHMKCSVCGWYWSIPEHRKVFLYCPHCGAKMDGGNDND